MHDILIRLLETGVLALPRSERGKEFLKVFGTDDGQHYPFSYQTINAFVLSARRKGLAVRTWRPDDGC